MAEKAAAKKRAPRQQMLEALAETEKVVAEKRESSNKAEEKAEAKVTAAAIAVAEDFSTRGVVESISELKSSISKTLAGMSDRLEEQATKYVQFQRAIAARDRELNEIYEIERSANTLTALFEVHEIKRAAMQTELASERSELESEVEQLRAQWTEERKQRDTESKERDTAELKRREREKEEYRYAFAREQQQARDAFADETAKTQKQLADTKVKAEADFAQREQSLAEREQELVSLRAKAEASPKELEAAVVRAVKETTARLTQESASREELLKRDHLGERNVLTTRITSLEQTVQEQSQRLTALLAQTEKAYAQVQEIAVRAVDGSAASKQLAGLQQLLADQPQKTPTTADICEKIGSKATPNAKTVSRWKSSSTPTDLKNARWAGIAIWSKNLSSPSQPSASSRRLILF